MRMKINCNNINPLFSEIINPADIHDEERVNKKLLMQLCMQKKTYIVISFGNHFKDDFLEALYNIFRFSKKKLFVAKKAVQDFYSFNH